MACKRKADEGAGLNQLPMATVSLKDVTLSDGTDLVSTVHLYWTGSDVDGFVKGFHILVNDSLVSGLVTRTDSTFRFSLTSGSERENLSFKIIAIDDKNAQSPPAEIILPIHNSRPVATFTLDRVPKSDTVLGVLVLPFSATDSDGPETLDSIFLRVNGGPWYGLPPTATQVGIVPQNPRATGQQAASIYLNGDAGSLQRRALQGLVVDGANVFELKATDKASATSLIAIIKGGDSLSRSITVRGLHSDLLVINAHTFIRPNPVNPPTPEQVYYPVLSQVYPGYDLLDIIANGGRNQPLLFAPTLTLLMNQYTKVFMFTDAVKANNLVAPTEYLFETAAPVLQNYVAKTGNHLLFTSNFPGTTARLTPTSSPNLFQFLPIDSLIFASNRTFMARGSLVKARQPDYPDLFTTDSAQNGISETGIITFYPGSTCDTLYTGPITLRGAAPQFPFSKAIAGRYPKGAIQPNLIFFTYELHKLAGNRRNTDPSPEYLELFRDILTRDFN